MRTEHRYLTTAYMTFDRDAQNPDSTEGAISEELVALMSSDGRLLLTMLDMEGGEQPAVQMSIPAEIVRAIVADWVTRPR